MDPTTLPAESRRHFPARVHPRLADSDREHVRAVSARADLPGGVLERLTSDGRPRVRVAAAGDPGLPVRCLPALLAPTRTARW
ncbi:hypothetical protein ABZ641_32730, partial [Kitasatospora sp. NPDC007106]